MLSIIPLDEIVRLDIVYEISTETGVDSYVSPLSGPMKLSMALRQAVSCDRLGIRVSITARGIVYKDPGVFRMLWSRESCVQRWRRDPTS